MEDIPLGAHLVSSRGGYTHHGIYSGEGFVIHYSGLSDGLNAGPVQEAPMDVFSQGRDVTLRKYKNPKYTGEAAVERARSRLGESAYDVHGNNCEHFCSWVVTGISRSGQVDSAEDFLDIFIPRPIILALKIRKHSVQGPNTADVTRDIIETVAVAATTVVATTTVPIVLGYKVAKWLLRRNS